MHVAVYNSSSRKPRLSYNNLRFITLDGWWNGVCYGVMSLSRPHPTSLKYTGTSMQPEITARDIVTEDTLPPRARSGDPNFGSEYLRLPSSRCLLFLLRDLIREFRKRLFPRPLILEKLAMPPAMLPVPLEFGGGENEGERRSVNPATTYDIHILDEVCLLAGGKGREEKVRKEGGWRRTKT